jgi:hypothetical protein
MEGMGRDVRKSEAPPKKKARKTKRSEKNKGLRHFSMKVCKKVEEKGTTTYNEVADELVAEFAEMRRRDEAAAAAAAAADPAAAAAAEAGKKKRSKKSYDEKNIRRRVYDALNVLMAMDIISKEKKEIKWKGLPSNAKHELSALRDQVDKVRQRVEQRKIHLAELLQQQIAFKNLVDRNRRATAAGEPRDQEECIPLPFIVVAADEKTVIRCEMADDRGDIFFNFDSPFEIHDDNEILQSLGLHTMSAAKLQRLIPPELLPYLPADACVPSPRASPAVPPPGGPSPAATEAEGAEGAQTEAPTS